MKARIGKKVKNTPESVQREIDKLEEEARAEEARYEAYEERDGWASFWEYEKERGW